MAVERRPIPTTLAGQTHIGVVSVSCMWEDTTIEFVVLGEGGDLTAALNEAIANTKRLR